MTNKIKLDKLVHALGMESEIRPLLDSNINGESGYVRFEKAIGEVLRNQIRCGDDEPYWPFGMEAFNVSERSSRIIKKYYGIECDDKSFVAVGDSEGVSGTTVKYWINKVEGIIKTPRYNLKRDIWYKTLG